MTDDERKIALSNILNSYIAPENLDAIETIVRMDFNPNTTIEDYVLALHDGLRYGNWPWVNRIQSSNTVRDFRGIE